MGRDRNHRRSVSRPASVSWPVGHLDRVFAFSFTYRSETPLCRRSILFLRVLVDHEGPVTDLFPQLSTLLQVVLIDVALSGDNAIVIALAAAGLPAQQRRQAILVGMGPLSLYG